MAYVAGYTIANDISTRDVMNRPKFPMTDFLMSKCRPDVLSRPARTWCPASSCPIRVRCVSH